MRPTVIREKNNWINIMKSGAKAVLAGKASGMSVMDALGLRVAADIARSITQVFAPPLKPGTIAARKRALTDKKTIGLLTKPLVASGKLLSDVTHITESSA